MPAWAKDTSGAARWINARAETIDTLASFRDAFKKRRCLVLASGFYEWRKVTPKEKQPHYITAKDRQADGICRYLGALDSQGRERTYRDSGNHHEI